MNIFGVFFPKCMYLLHQCNDSVSDQQSLLKYTYYRFIVNQPMLSSSKSMLFIRQTSSAYQQAKANYASYDLQLS